MFKFHLLAVLQVCFFVSFAQAGDAETALEKAIEQQLEQSMKHPDLVEIRILDADVSYLDGGTEGVAIVIGAVARLIVAIPNSRSQLSKDGKRTLVVSMFDSLLLPVEVQKGSELSRLLTVYLEKAVKPQSRNVQRRLTRIRKLLSDLRSI